MPLPGVISTWSLVSYLLKIWAEQIIYCCLCCDKEELQHSLLNMAHMQLSNQHFLLFPDWGWIFHKEWSPPLSVVIKIILYSCHAFYLLIYNFFTEFISKLFEFFLILFLPVLLFRLWNCMKQHIIIYT